MELLNLLTYKISHDRIIIQTFDYAFITHFSNKAKRNKNKVKPKFA